MNFLYRAILNENGIQKQTVVLAEECGELVKEASKMCRGRGSKAALVEEMADVTIMIEQMCEHYGIEQSDIRLAKEKKLVRIAERFDNGIL